MNNFYKICLERKNISKALLALWLIFMINVLTCNWDEVYQILSVLTLNIDNLNENQDDFLKKINVDYSDKIQIDYKQILINRGYLLHWGLLLLNEKKNGLEKYLNIFFDDKNLPIVDNSFRSLLKYGIVLSLITKSRKFISILKRNFFNSTNAVDILEKNNACYFNLFDALYINFDMDKVRICMEECKNVSLKFKLLKDMNEDYFLSTYINVFNDKIREIMMDNYIELHNSFNFK